MKKLLPGAALVLALAALQSPLWRPNAPPQIVTAAAGGTTFLSYQGSVESAVLFRPRTAMVTAAGPGLLKVQGRTPGITSLLIRYKDGKSQIYQIVILPG